MEQPEAFLRNDSGESSSTKRERHGNEQGLRNGT